MCRCTLVGGAFWDALGTGFFALVGDGASTRDTGVLGARLLIRDLMCFVLG